MSDDPRTSNRSPRLNPFAFPSDTDFRFLLLIVSVVGAGLFVYNLLYFSVPEYGERYATAVLQCVDAVKPYRIDPLDPESSAAVSAIADTCIAEATRPTTAWSIAGLGVLLVVAAAIYCFLPAWKIWRGKLVPLGADDAPEVVAYLADLCHEAGISRPPIFLWNPLNPTSSGLAFGRLRRYYVSLTGGLLAQFYTDRPAFRAVVLHELAHLRNGDVNKTYFTIAIWRAFVPTALVPLGLAILGNPLRDVGALGWRALAIVVLVFLTRNAVLRTREVYADVRASVWDGPNRALRRLVEALPPPTAGLWGRIAPVHPDPRERRQAMDDTDRLFRVSFWDALGTGIAASIAFPSVESFLTGLLTGTQRTSWAPTAAALVFAPLAAGVVGAGIWRASFGALARGQTGRSVWHLSLGLGLGIVLGRNLSFMSFVESGLPQTGFADPVVRFLLNVLWSGLLLVGLHFFLHWMSTAASAWLEVTAHARSPRLVYIPGLVVLGAALGVWSGFLFLAERHAIGGLIDPRIFLSFGAMAVTVHPILFAMLISLWAYPLAAWWWRRRTGETPAVRWAYLDTPAQPLRLPRQPPFRLTSALLTGLVGGLLYCGVLLVVRILVRLLLPEAVRSSSSFLFAYYLGQVGVAALMQVGVAAVVAGRVRRLSEMHGLFAAFVAGCVMAVGLLGLNLLFGGTAEWAFVWQVFAQVINVGALLALPVAFGVSAFARRVHP